MRKYGIVLDLFFLLLFVGIGRSTHHDVNTIAGFANTLWPFGAGLLAGWVLSERTHRNSLSPRGGLLIVSITVLLGMSLRVVSGQGTALSFTVVAFAFLSISLVGWRYGLSFFSRAP